MGDISHGRPFILLPIFFQCPGVCTNELDQMFSSIQEFKRDSVGQSFDVVVLSIDHTETAQIAAAKKQWYVDFYQHHITSIYGAPRVAGRENAASGFHFIVGSEKNVKTLTDQIGFVFTRDSKSGNLVHPAALVVMTPAGKISRYFLTTEYPEQMLLNAIHLAGREAVGVRDERPFYLACIHIDPLTGQRSLDILNVVKTAGCLTLALLAFSIVAMTIREKKKSRINESNV